MTYEPTGGPVGKFAEPGTLLMEIPELGNRLFVSPESKTWSAVQAQIIPPRDLSLTAVFTAPGSFLAATNLPELTTPAGRASRGTLALGLAIAALALVMFVGTFTFVRRRSRRAS